MSTSEREDEPREGVRRLDVIAWKGDPGALLERLREGEAGAVAILYDRYQAKINAIVWRIMGADSEHDDLVQRVFIQMMRGIKSLDDASKLDAWVRSVTVNMLRSELRRRRVRRIMALDTDGVEMHLAPSTDHEARESVRRVYEILEDFSADHRIVFTLRFIDGQSLDEIAEACDCSRSTIKRRLKRAQERFVKLAQKDPLLSARLAQGDRWTTED